MNVRRSLPLLFFAAAAPLRAQPADAPGPDGAGGPPPPAVPVPDDPRMLEQAGRIHDLIQALGGGDPAVRDAARRELIRVGAAAVPFLEDHLRKKGALDFADVLRQIDAQDAFGRPFRAEDYEKRLPQDAEIERAAKGPPNPKATEAYVLDRYHEAVQWYRKREYDRALALTNALLVLEPRSPLRSRLQELRMLCDHQSMQQHVLTATIVPGREAYTIGEEIDLALRIENVSPVEIRLAFGLGGEPGGAEGPAAAPGAHGQAVADVFAILRDPLGMTRTVQRAVEWTLPPLIVIPPRGRWEQRVTVGTQEDDATLNPTFVRVYDVGVRLFPARLWIGDRPERKRVRFEAGTAKAFPAGVKWRADDPLACLGATLDDKRATLNEVFLAALRVPKRDAGKAAAILVQAIPRFRDEAQVVLMVALGDLTGEPFGLDARKWLEWGGIKIDDSATKVQNPKAGAGAGVPPAGAALRKQTVEK